MAVKPVYRYTPQLISLTAWLWIVGPFTGVQYSAIRRWTVGRGILTLHVACDTEVTVAVRIRKVARWHTVFMYTGMSFGTLIKTLKSGCDVQFIVVGEGNGIVEVVVQ